MKDEKHNIFASSKQRDLFACVNEQLKNYKETDYEHKHGNGFS